MYPEQHVQVNWPALSKQNEFSLQLCVLVKHSSIFSRQYHSNWSLVNINGLPISSQWYPDPVYDKRQVQVKWPAVSSQSAFSLQLWAFVKHSLTFSHLSLLFKAKPVRHWQPYDPGMFLHCSSGWQLSLPREHSLMSLHCLPFPVYPSRHWHN